MKKRTGRDQFVTDDDGVRLGDGTVTTIKELRAHYLSPDDYKRKMKVLAAEEIALKAKKADLLRVEQWLKFLAELRQKLTLLCEQYGIAPAQDGDIDWRALALTLAAEHEPGFLPKQKRGRKELFTRDVMLVLDVEHLKAERPDHTDSGAIHILVTATRFAKRWQGVNERTLENALVKARKDKKVVEIIAGMRETAREKGWPDLWQVLDRGYGFRLGAASRK